MPPLRSDVVSKVVIHAREGASKTSCVLIVPEEEGAKRQHLQLAWTVRDPLDAKIDGLDVPPVPSRNLNLLSEHLGLKGFAC